MTFGERRKRELACLVALGFIVKAQTSSLGSYMHLFDFKVKDTMPSNEVIEVTDDSLPRSLHHLAFGRDGMLYASSFVTSEVYGGFQDETGQHWRWFRVVSR
eukprot:CAMPEP_0196737062 /NCGR_PEP_ID=MMETSP1091-20130531/14910_1 /TAXON_ID=302021 /ORGANISM="Rhodomonas sp., Strain CCMP768" /LENGTH=101 /DNA_ID=CAMNT_0042080865 /DNA_START=9 /DNA_END=311 /DNA_ORIENTATION=+